jgi:putative protease
MTQQPMENIELLAPAGNPEKLEIAIHYGADAVYLAGKDFSLRNFSGNFTMNELAHAVHYAHQNGVKVYVACNIYARNHEQQPIHDFLVSLKAIGPDAVIISDPGILMMARHIVPEIAVHLSTQASTTNFNAALFWKSAGVKRINAARELTLDEISRMASTSGMEIEAFVHGAMCISYSGRCLLSSFMAQRDSNRGRCCHPCRFEYAVVEARRPGQYYPIAEDQRGSYIFNAKDLCMIEHLPRMIAAGITSLKIEGRMKGIHYLATTVKTYRTALDACRSSPENYQVRPEWMEALARIGNRGYCTGFYLGNPEETLPDCTGAKIEDQRFIAKAVQKLDANFTQVDVRNKFLLHAPVEVISAGEADRRDCVCEILDGEGQPVDCAQPGTRVTIKLQQAALPNDLIRKVVS